MIGHSSNIQPLILKTVPMIRILAVTATLAALFAPGPVAADEQRTCLTKAEQRAAISQGQTVTLAAAIRSARGTVRGRGAREVVNARLCRENNTLVYVLTVLARDGKVTHTSVDATSGKVVDAR